MYITVRADNESGGNWTIKGTHLYWATEILTPYKLLWGVKTWISSDVNVVSELELIVEFTTFKKLKITNMVNSNTWWIYCCFSYNLKKYKYDIKSLQCVLPKSLIRSDKIVESIF